jgi:signal transduction histidine kinase
LKTFRFLPVYYGYSQSGNLSGVEKLPLIDFFALSDSAESLRLKFHFRHLDALEKETLARESQDQAVRLATLDTTLKQREEFLGVCAHDLRSPLALIQTCLSLVMQSPETMARLNPPFAELLSRAHRQSGQALGLVKDLLDVAAFEQGLKPHYQVLSLHDLLKEFVSDYQLQAQQKAIHLHYFNSVPQWRVLADSDRIRQLLQNLFTNALKFSEAGKNIYLHVTPFQGRRRNDPVHPMVIISLKDEGKGIPSAEIQNIFDRFVQLKEHSREGGRGLGLTVAKQISTLHDGNIWVESEEGKGATFFVLFPHAISRSIPVRLSSPIKKILVAEPSQERRKNLLSKFTAWGYEVDFALDGVEAITLTHHLAPDAVVLAPELKKIGTAEVTHLLKSDPHLRGLPVLLMTSNNGPQPKLQESVLADAIVPATFSESQWREALARCQSTAPQAA